MKILETQIELAWSAGFLDGEGSFGTYKESSSTSKYRYRIQCAQVHREPLDRLQAALGGSVRGPYGPYKTTKQAYFQWAVHSDEAVNATYLLMPYLSSVKSEQATAAMEKRES